MVKVLGDSGTVGADNERVGPRRDRGTNSCLGILKCQAPRRRYAKQPCSIEVSGRVGLADRHLIAGDEDFGYIQPGSGHTPGGKGAWRGGHEGDPCPPERLKKSLGARYLCDSVDSIHFQGMEFRNHRGWINPGWQKLIDGVTCLPAVRICEYVRQWDAVAVRKLCPQSLNHLGRVHQCAIHVEQDRFDIESHDR